MKRWICLLLLLCAIAGCVTPPQSTGWVIVLKGKQQTEVNAAFYNDAQIHGSHYKEIKLEKKGKELVYNAMPFYLIVAMADGDDTKHPYTFDRQLWENGYDITLTARDGYSATFNTKDIPFTALYLADRLNGQQIAPAIVGDMPGNLWVKELVEVEFSLPAASPVDTSCEFVFNLEVNGKVFPFTLAQLKASLLYREDKGSFTTSAGTKYSNVYGGIPIAPFLNQYLPLAAGTTVRMIAMDDYEMIYSGKDLLDESNGTWILAFIMDGQPLPLDPGYIRTVKIGAQDPNIDGHLSVKMVKKIIVEGNAYRDFSLTITGKTTFVLDRRTLQSGVNCHTHEAAFERKNIKAQYTGIPLWRLLAYADDPQYAPHKQDSTVLSYNKEAAQEGYTVEIIATDGFTITLDSKEIDGNNDVILALYKEGEELPEGEWPLILVWDKDAKVVPSGIKPVKMIQTINLVF